MDRGYIIVWRKIIDSSIWQNAELLRFWIWCLMRANHTGNWVTVRTGRGSKSVYLDRGQFIFGRNATAKKIDRPPSTIRNWLHKLRMMQKLDIQKDTHYSIVTIRHYEYFQSVADVVRSRKGPSKGQPKDTENTLKTLKNNTALKTERKKPEFDSFGNEIPEF